MTDQCGRKVFLSNSTVPRDLVWGPQGHGCARRAGGSCCLSCSLSPPLQQPKAGCAVWWVWQLVLGCYRVRWHRQGSLWAFLGTARFLCTHQSDSQDAPDLRGQLPLDQKPHLGNPNPVISTQPGLASKPKPNVEIAYAYFKLVIPVCELVFVFLPQEPGVILTDLICLLGFGCRNNCWQPARPAPCSPTHSVDGTSSSNVV